MVSSEGLDQNVLLSFDPDLQRPAKKHRALLHSDVCDPAFSPLLDRGVRLPRQVILFLAERPQQVQMFWVADCHSRVQDQGAHVVFVDHSFHPRDPGHVDLNINNKLSRPHTDPESTDDQQKHRAKAETHHGVDKDRVSQAEHRSGSVCHTLDRLADGPGDLQGQKKKKV